MYVLVERDTGYFSQEYYKGGSYIVQGECYPCVGDKRIAKTYSSEKRAKNACEKLNRKFGRCFEVEELIE